ncbi:MAG: hypothetical protein KGI71_05775 [Patescibacteria group bacterium]|nr:hypothetical protein [Patescibacteria group bacterium]
MTEQELEAFKKKALDKAKKLQDYYVEDQRVQERNSLLTSMAIGFANSFATVNGMKDGYEGDREISRRAFSLARTMLEERVKHLQERPEPPEQEAMVMGMPGLGPCLVEEIPPSGSSLPSKKS